MDGHYGLTDWSIDRLNETNLSLYQLNHESIKRFSVKLAICVPMSVLPQSLNLFILSQALILNRFIAQRAHRLIVAMGSQLATM